MSPRPPLFMPEVEIAELPPLKPSEQSLLEMHSLLNLFNVMRDLVANARKYTPPGGHITLAAHESQQELRVLVEDTGRGIPADEITTVVQFGRRARNVGDVRTMGGGFGLTKAVFVTKQFGGRFWIASEVGAGTRIKISVPRPAPGELN
ncbi:MAG: ATP-binding protein [Verrucomicrobia bacterium]|nr:ATP-binding protein [Verrucomicrobiota bacterium]